MSDRLPVRKDLLALTPEGIASLANMGLVKRAQRELAEGAGPALSCEADGTVVGTWADATVARLVPGKSFVDCPCSCGAQAVCRHRIAVALAYPAWHATQTAAGVSPETEGEAALAGRSPESPRAEPPWSPADITDEALLHAMGERMLSRARAVLRSSTLVTLDFASPPTARLPACTVRFLVPMDVAYARCDCAAAGACEHQALAVWAFRAGGLGDAVVLLGGRPGAAMNDLSLEDTLAPLLRPLLVEGLGHAPPHAAATATARVALDRRGARWLVGLVNELEQALEGWHARSSLYGAMQVRRLVVEAEARVRASIGTSELPPAYVLGEGEASETLLDHVRLVSLGARLRADGDTRYAQVFLADADTSTVLVLNKTWHGVKDDGEGLARKSVATRVSLQQLACGQVVSKAVTRRANRSVEIGGARAALTSVTPQRGDWGALPAPLMIRDLAAFRVNASARPPVFLRPRVLAENVHVIAVSEVARLVYRAAEQTLEADLVDAEGNLFTATVTHRSVAPFAIDAAAAAFQGPVRFVAGELGRGTNGAPVLEVLAIAGETLVVPDLAAKPLAPGAPPGAPPGNPPGDSPGDPPGDWLVVQRGGSRGGPTDVLSEARVRTGGLLDELLHAGLRLPPMGLVSRVSAHGGWLSDLGLTGLGGLVTGLGASLAMRDAEASRLLWLETALFGALLDAAEGA